MRLIDAREIQFHEAVVEEIVLDYALRVYCWPPCGFEINGHGPVVTASDG